MKRKFTLIELLVVIAIIANALSQSSGLESGTQSCKACEMYREFKDALSQSGGICRGQQRLDIAELHGLPVDE